MKKLLSLISLMGIFVTGFSQWQSGPQRQNDQQNKYDTRQNNALVINADAQKNFTVVIDNGAQYQSNGNAVTINSLYNGSHSITIYESTRGFWGKQKQREIYSSAIYLKSGIETSIYINSYGQVNVSERQLYNYNNQNNGQNCNGKKDNGRRRHGHKDHNDEGNKKDDNREDD